MDIETVTVEPTYCHRCGAEVGTNTFERRECSWCSECDLYLLRKPIPIVQVIVHDSNELLLLDEPISWKEDKLSLPGGHVHSDEGPRESLLRELYEETTIEATSSDLEFVTIYHSESPDRSWYLITYALELDFDADDLETEADDFRIEMRSLNEISANPDLMLPAAFERIQMYFESE